MNGYIPWPLMVRYYKQELESLERFLSEDPVAPPPEVIHGFEFYDVHGVLVGTIGTYDEEEQVHYDLSTDTWSMVDELYEL